MCGHPLHRRRQIRWENSSYLEMSELAYTDLTYAGLESQGNTTCELKCTTSLIFWHKGESVSRLKKMFSFSVCYVEMFAVVTNPSSVTEGGIGAWELEGRGKFYFREPETSLALAAQRCSFCLLTSPAGCR